MSKDKNKKHENEEQEKCSCGCEQENCDCGEDCECHEHHKKGECDCGDDCKCNDHHKKENCDCKKDVNLAGEYLLMAQRIQAEFDNYRKRNQEAEKKARLDGTINAVEKLLPIVDSINSAIRQVKDESFKKSIEMLYSQTMQAFNTLGVSKIEALNKPFDPNFHNAIMAEEVEGTKPDIVTEEFQEGFAMGDKVIRHSVVKVSK